MKVLVLTALVSLFTVSAFAKNTTEVSRKIASNGCAAANKELAQAMINNAAKRISNKAAEVTLSWTNATGDRFVYSSAIYKAEYEVVVKTDSSCFPLEVELIDLARR